MDHDKEMLLKINLLANEMIKQIICDKAIFKENQSKIAVENLSRALIDLTSTQLDGNYDEETTLQAALSKVKISYNAILQSN